MTWGYKERNAPNQNPWENCWCIPFLQHSKSDELSDSVFVLYFAFTAPTNQKMAKLTVFLGLLTLSTTLAKPAKKEALDKATAIDVVINSVHPEKVNTNPEEEKNFTGADTTKSNSDVYLTDVSFGTPTSNVKPGATVARIIDDIFQIPISVLQSVARLLRNPFISQKTPEKASSY